MRPSEDILREVFSQIPDIPYYGKDYPVKFEWGGIDDLNLYMVDCVANPTPLIWLVQGSAEEIKGINRQEYTRRIKLIIAKSSEHKENRNPTVWDTEFREVLNPLFDKVIACLTQSGKTQVIEGSETVMRQANYSEDSREVKDDTDTVSKTIDHWNVIVYEAEVIFSNFDNCIQTIYFKQ